MYVLGHDYQSILGIVLLGILDENRLEILTLSAGIDCLDGALVKYICHQGRTRGVISGQNKSTIYMRVDRHHTEHKLSKRSRTSASSTEYKEMQRRASSAMHQERLTTCCCCAILMKGQAFVLLQLFVLSGAQGFAPSTTLSVETVCARRTT